MESAMNYSVVLNAYLDDLSSQFDQLQGFLNDNFQCTKASHIIIVCPKDNDIKNKKALEKASLILKKIYIHAQFVVI